LTKWNKRSVSITEVVAETDDLRDAPEVLPERDEVSESSFRMVEKAGVRTEFFPESELAREHLRETGDIVLPDSNSFWTVLLIVTNHDDALREQQQR